MRTQIFVDDRSRFGVAWLTVRVLDSIAPARLGASFRWLLGSWWISNLGDGLALAAGPLLVASQTSNPSVVALAVLLQRLPWLLFGLYAGVVADRLNRRKVVMVADGSRVAVLVALIAMLVTGRVNIAVVLVVMFVLGAGETFADTTSSAILPMIVGKRDLGAANSRLMGGFIVTNQLAGPPIGAALFTAGRCWPFVSQAVCVALGVLLVSRSCYQPPARRPVRMVPPPGSGGDRGGLAVAVAASAGAHPGDNDLHFQRDLRLRLVGAGPLLP